ncbi:MAG: hypothetical protein ACI4QE_04725, partial [Acutalibacteraceae bacterium]
WGNDYSQSIDLNDSKIYVDYHDTVETLHENAQELNTVFRSEYLNRNLPCFITAGFFDATTAEKGAATTDPSTLKDSDFKYRAYNERLYELSLVAGYDTSLKISPVKVYFDLHTDKYDSVYLYLSSTTDKYAIPYTYILNRLGDSTIYSTTVMLPFVEDAETEEAYKTAYTFDNIKVSASGATYAIPDTAQPTVAALKSGEVWFEVKDLFLTLEDIDTSALTSSAALNPFEGSSSKSSSKKDLIASAAGVDVISSGLTCSGGYVYFDASEWDTSSYSVVQLCIGHSSYTSCYTMSKLSGTNLYYYSMPSWSGATYIAFIANSSSWGSGNWSTSNLSNAKCYTGTINYSLNSGNTYLFTKASSSNGAALTGTYYSTGYSGINSTNTAQVKVSTDGGATYSNAADTSAASVTISGSYYYISANGKSTSATSGSSSYSYSKDLANTSSVTFSTTNNDSANYEFVGWSSNGSTADLGSASTYSYTVSSSAKTVYALYKLKQYSVSVNTTVGSGVSSSPTASVSKDTVLGGESVTVTFDTASDTVMIGAFTVNGVSKLFDGITKSSGNTYTYEITDIQEDTAIEVTFINTSTAFGSVNITGNSTITTSETTTLSANSSVNASYTSG